MSLRPTEGTRVLVTLPYPPLLNHMYIKTRRGVFLSPDVPAYRLVVCNAVSLQTNGEYFEADQRLKITLNVYRPRRTGDIDATQKAIFDALNGVLWHDDKQIYEMHVYRHDDKFDPRVSVMVEAV